MAEISLKNVTLDLPIYSMKSRSFKQTLASTATGGIITNNEEAVVVIRALENISLTIRAGEKIGVVGHNGAGKTTLLRLIAGIYKPTYGSISVTGDVASILDISLGMEEEATGYENILIRGVLMGRSVAQMRKKIDFVREISGLGDYLDMPIRIYSSGMRMRLGFAISVAMEAEIYLMDEWLLVGDAKFRSIATEQLHKLVHKASILILTSHNEDIVQNTCTQIIQLNKGRLVEKPWLGKEKASKQNKMNA